MKKIIIMVMCFAVALAMSVPASAIELSPDAANIPPTYAKVVDGKVVYDWKSMAYSPVTFNEIMNAYGLELTPEAVAGLPSNYAKVVDDKVVYDWKSMAYSTGDYHKIFTAYGLELSPEDAATIPADLNYCKVVDGEVTFPNWKSTAYSGVGLSQILAAYKLPVVIVEEIECVDSDGDSICDEVDVCNDTPKGVEVDERGCWVLEQTYLFDFDKYDVKPEFYPLLDRIAVVLNDNPNVSLQIEGHTDSIGTEQYNMGLSERRANAIKNAIAERNGIDPARMNAVGFGESNPIATNETAEGRALNRRVELKPIW